MIITNHREKLINAIIYFARRTKKCGKVKLMKLLYFLDFVHFKQTGKSVTGLEYYAWDFGPVPVEIFEEVSSRMKDDLANAVSVIPVETERGPFHLIKAKPGRDFDAKYFTKREMRLLEETAQIFKEADAEQMAMVSHLPNRPWDRTLKEKGEKAKIDYLYAVDDTEESLSYNEAKERMQEISEMHEIFGTV